MSQTERQCRYSLSMPVRWGDMDALGHVNNAVYFTYLEQARAAWLKALALDFVGEAQGPVVLNAAMTYLKPVVFPDELEVRIFYDAIGRSSLDLSYELWSSAQSALVATSTSRLVWVDYAGNRPVPVPDVIRAQFGAA